MEKVLTHLFVSAVLGFFAAYLLMGVILMFGAVAGKGALLGAWITATILIALIMPTSYYKS